MTGLAKPSGTVPLLLLAIDYLHRDPLRRGLVELAVDWQWSSARWYEALPYEPNIRLPNLESMRAEFLVPTAR